MITPDKELEWSAYERRNPGVKHPDRAKYDNDQGRKKYLDDWENPLGIRREFESFGDRARRSRLGM